MRTLIEIGVAEKTLLFALIMAGVLLAVVLLMSHRYEKRYMPHLLVEGICLAISYMEFHMMVATMSYIYDGMDISGWRTDFANKPVMFYLAVQLAVVLVEAMLLAKDYKWRKNHLSFNSIKESMDSMPYGICCYYAGGMPRLINEEMQAISKALFGEVISNAALFWERISSETSGAGGRRITTYSSPTWMIDGGQVVSFARTEIPYEKGFLYEILAADITEEYEKTEKLSVEKERMRAVTDKLKEYSKNVTRLTIEKEVLDAKVKVHSELGQTLVATRRYFAARDVDEKTLLSMWDKNIKMLKREASSVSQEDYAVLSANARQLGIALAMPDTLPEEEDVKEIIIAAGNECITNAYKYAASKALAIDVHSDAREYDIRIWNKGDSAAEDIEEHGGLLNLRKMIETKGGTMSLTSKPYFCLAITIEKR